jgi:uncharacterized protein (DUF342 family)
MDTQESTAIHEATEAVPKVIVGDVGITTGNVDASGPLVIQGDILSGATVRSRGMLEVMGNVEDAILEVEGDVTIRQGFTGTGKGRIEATGTVKVLHVRNQQVTAGKDVFVERECINATIHSGGKICAPRAVISGGRLDAMTEIELGELGLADDASPKIRVGHRARIIEQLGTLEKELGAADRQLREVKDAVYKLVKIKVDGGSLPPANEALLTKLQGAQKMLPERIAAMHAERSALQVELQKKSDARIVVHGTAQADTMIEVNGARKILEVAVSAAEFTERDGALEAHSL